MARINNLAIPGVGGGGPDPLSPPLDPPMKILTSCCYDLSGTKKRQIFLSKYLCLIRPFRAAAVEQKVCQHNISNVST